MRWTAQQVAHALGAAVPFGIDASTVFSGVSIDSRTIRRGELFVAIRGPQHDGHAFVGAAFEAGASGAIVARDCLSTYPEKIRSRLLGAADTLVALQELARAVRRTWGRRIAAVTGSAGKTTTKEILAALLGTRLHVLKSEGNFNNEYGLPLGLLRLGAEHEAAVMELGMSHSGELRRLAEIAEPEVGVVTSVAPVHLEFFESVDEIALAKRELIEGLAGPDPVAVLNADDTRVARFAEIAAGRVLTFGFGAQADFRAEDVQDRGAEGSEFVIVAPGERVKARLGLPGRHNIANSLAALAAASIWGIEARTAAEIFPELAAGEMRGRLLRFAEGFALINDAYNSNPVALRAMMDLLAKTPNFKRRIVVAGEMLELGANAPELHRETGREAALDGLNWVIGVRGHAAQIVNGAAAAGLPEGRAKFFEDVADAANFVTNLVQPGDLVLVKGSRGVKMERVVEALKARYALAAETCAPGGGTTRANGAAGDTNGDARGGVSDGRDLPVKGRGQN